MNDKTPRKWSDFEKWITGSMLQGRKVTLTIKALQIVKVHPQGGQETQSPALAFAETAKMLVLSTTNCRTLAGIFGDDIEAAQGKRITLEAVPMRVAGKDRLPVRISPAAAPKPTTASPAPGEVDPETGEVGEDAPDLAEDESAE